MLRECVYPSQSINCEKFEDVGFEATEEKPKHPAIHNSGIILNALEQNSVPLSAVNNPPMDSIEKQMLHLKQLISTFHSSTKEVSYNGHNAQKPQPQGSHLQQQSLLIRPSYQKDPLPIQLSEITEQLRVPAPAPALQTNLNVFQSNGIKYEGPNFTTYPFISYVPNDLNTKQSNKLKPQLRPDINLSIFNKNKHPPSSLNTDPHDSAKLEEEVEDYYSYDDADRFDYNQENNGDGMDCVVGTRFPNLSDCRKYHICGASDKDTFYDFTCPSTMAFDKLKMICDVKAYKHCIKENIKRDKVTYV